MQSCSNMFNLLCKEIFRACSKIQVKSIRVFHQCKGAVDQD